MLHFRLFKTVQWKVIAIYMLLFLLAMQFIGAYFARQVESYYTTNFSNTLNAQAMLLATHLTTHLERYSGSKEEVPEVVKQDIDNLINNMVALDDAQVKVQVVDGNGTVISTTEDDQTIVGQRTSQKEVTVALLGTSNEDLRVDPRTGHRVKVLAVPIKRNNIVYGAVYMIASMENMYRTMKQVMSILATGTGIALLMTVGLGVVLARTITKPVKEMTQQATAVAEGNFDRTVRIYSGDEIGQLGQAFNYMTRRLHEAILQQEEEREKLSQILANMSDGVIAADRNGEIILLNRAAEEMLQTKEAEVLANRQTVYDLLRLPSEDEMPLSSLTAPLMLEFATANQDLVMLQVTFSPLQQDSGRKGGIIAVLQDVTERVRLDQQRREFVANVSHELRTPLTTIKSYVEALQDGAVEDPNISHQFLGVTMTETERMIRLVNDLLQLSRFDSQGVKLYQRPMEFIPFIRTVADRFRVQSEQKGIHMELLVPASLPLVYGDPDALNQVLDNLLSNAIKYTPEGGSVSLQAEADEHQRRVIVRVQDTGIGIPKRDLRRVFERFYRVDKARSRSQGGTGLGLAIAKELVQAHGANIHIESEWKKGTTVTFWLPLAEGGDNG